jgi:hypothetical protein
MFSALSRRIGTSAEPFSSFQTTRPHGVLDARHRGRWNTPYPGAAIVSVRREMNTMEASPGIDILAGVQDDLQRRSERGDAGISHRPCLDRDIP